MKRKYLKLWHVGWIQLSQDSCSVAISYEHDNAHSNYIKVFEFLIHFSDSLVPKEGCVAHSYTSTL